MNTLSPSTRRTVLLYSVLCGLCPLIPVPLVDDWIQGVVARRMVRALCAERGLSPPREAVLHLSRERASCSWGCLVAPVVWPVKQLLKKVLFFLSFKSCVDASVRWLHRGWLLARVLDRGDLVAAQLSPPEGVWPVVLAMEEALDGTKKSPITTIVRRTFHGSRRLLYGLAARMMRTVSPTRGGEEEQAESALGEVKEREQALLDQLVGQLEAEVWQDGAYWEAIEARYVEKKRPALPLTTG